MNLERSTVLPVIGVALAACVWAARTPEPAAAQGLQDSVTSKTFALVRTAGTCPKSITIATRAKPYEGGAEVAITARTRAFAVAPGVVVARPGRIEFRAAHLRPEFSSCEATARFSDAANAYTFALHAGQMRFALVPSAELTLLGTSAASGDCTIKFGVAD